MHGGADACATHVGQLLVQDVRVLTAMRRIGDMRLMDRRNDDDVLADTCDV